MAASRSTELFFIVDGTRLEAQACLLAPSLKRHMMAGQSAVAYVRQDYRPSLDPFTLDVLAACGVAIRDIPGTDGGHGPWAAPYPHGNKILAAAAPRDCDVSVFLDTDTLLVEPIDFASELGDALIGACVSDYASASGSDADWAQFYAALDLPLPADRVQLNAGRRLTSLPYFNAGVIVFRERTDDGMPTAIGRDWLRAALRFERDVTIAYTRSNIDQLTLPILGYLRHAPVKALGQHMNFNIQSFGTETAQRQVVAHYHRLGVLWKHHCHGRFALECLAEVMGEAAPQTLQKIFGAHTKRNRMKHHLRAMDTAQAARVQPDAAASAPAQAASKVEEQRQHDARGNADQAHAA